MASDQILTTAQAQAVYSAMCALNNIGAVIDVEIPGGCGGTRIQETFTGSVRIEQRWDDRKSERYADQAAFAAAYGLPCGMAFTVAHVDHGAIVVDHVQAPSGDAALAQAQQQGLTDPVVFAGHIKAQASA